MEEEVSKPPRAYSVYEGENGYVCVPYSYYDDNGILKKIKVETYKFNEEGEEILYDVEINKF